MPPAKHIVRSGPVDGHEPPLDSHEPPHVSQISKLQELVYLGMTRLQIVLLSNPVTRVLHSSPSSSQPSSPWSGHKHGPLSTPGLFNFHYIEPMFLWWGLNTRILLGPAVGRVPVKDSFESRQAGCVNGASHNYAGSYLLNGLAEALHRLCLDELPVTLDSGLLLDAVHEEIARFWSADLAMTTTTGYGANYLAMPALLAMLRDEGAKVAVFCDEHCHNSIFTGVYLGMGRLGGVSLGRFAHNNAATLGEMLDATSPDAIKLVVIEGLYSMEGDVPPLSALAALKKKHDFILYCDEAHSFLSIGKTGRGCFEHATDAGISLPRDLIDIRTGTLSKAVGGIGGYITGKSAFVQHLSSHPQQPVSTATLVQTLWVVRQPLLARRNLSRLSATAAFCRRELSRLGVYTYGSSNTPVVPVWTGRSSVSARFSYELRRRGVLASPITTPAVPFWESRVRVNLSADFSPEDVNRLVCAIVEAARRTGVVRSGGSRVPTPAVVGMSDGKTVGLPAETLQDEARTAFDAISRLILQTSRGQTPHCRPPALTAAGHAARRTYGVASGGSRWISGTYPPHMTPKARTGTDAAMTLDSGSRSPPGRFRGQEARHAVPGASGRYVEDGLALVPPALGRKGGCGAAVMWTPRFAAREAGVPKGAAYGGRLRAFNRRGLCGAR